MQKTTILKMLEEFCRKLSITVRYDRFFGKGGYCRLREKKYFIINEHLCNEAKEQIFIKELTALDHNIELPDQLKVLLNR